MASGTWAVDASGNWSTAGNWSGGTIADGATFTANFTNNITATRTVTVDTARTIGSIVLSDTGAGGSAWSIAGSSTLTLDNGASSPTLNVVTFTTVSAAVGGTSGFTRSGSAEIQFVNSNPATNTLQGAVVLTTNRTSFGNGSFNTSTSTVPVNQLPNATSISVAAGCEFFAWCRASDNPTITSSVSGDGLFYVVGPSTWSDAGTTPGLNFTGSLANLGPATPALNTGLMFLGNQFTFNNRSIVTGIDAPRCMTYVYGGYANTATFVQQFGFGPTAVGRSYPTKIYVHMQAGGVTGTGVSAPRRLVANHTNGNGGITLTGGIERVDGQAYAFTVPFTLGGANTDNNTISGSIIQGSPSGPLSIVKADAGKWILSGPSSTFTGGVTVSASGGTLSAQSNAALGGTSGTVTVSGTGGTLELDGPAACTYNKSSAVLSLTGTGISSGGALRNVANNNTYQASSLTLGGNASISVAAGTTLDFQTATSWTGANTLTLVGGGTFKTTASTSFAHAFTLLAISAGTYEIANPLNNGGAAGTLGTSTAAAANLLLGTNTTSGTLKWSGSASTSTDKNWTIGTGGAAIDASGQGVAVLTLSGTTPAFSQANTACTFALKGSGGTAGTPNSAAVNLGNNGTGAVTLAKQGAGAWRMTSTSLAHTTTDISDGSLSFNNNDIGTNFVLSGTGVLREARLTTTTGRTVVCSGGTPEIVTKTATNNTCDCPVNVTGGVLRLTTDMAPTSSNTDGKILGNSAVTVSTGAGIRTTGSSPQRGQVRYGGNLRFNAGAHLYLGGN